MYRTLELLELFELLWSQSGESEGSKASPGETVSCALYIFILAETTLNSVLCCVLIRETESRALDEYQ